MPDTPPRFDPTRPPKGARYEPETKALRFPEAEKEPGGPDARSGAVYVYHDDDLVLAINVALATGRPLLLSGPSGSGKSAVARNVARYFDWDYLEYVVTHRSEAEDLIYRFDAVRRLNDAQAASHDPEIVRDVAHYIEEGPLWRALAARNATQPSGMGSNNQAEANAVLLIDEIDKAEPDFPSALLVPLGSGRFTVPPLGRDPFQATRSPLIVITDNSERDLPETFLRRCIVHNLRSPREPELSQIAREQVPELVELPEQVRDQLLKEAAALILSLQSEHGRGGAARYSTAEYLDTLRACCALQITDPSDALFARLGRLTVAKPLLVAGRTIISESSPCL